MRTELSVIVLTLQTHLLNSQLFFAGILKTDHQHRMLIIQPLFAKVELNKGEK